MPVVYNSSKNVLEAAKERMAFVFDNFESIVIAVSGGKDSTVLAHLAMCEAIQRNRKVGMHFLDEEVVYNSTVEQVRVLMNMFPEHTNPLWLQIQFALTNATSVTEGQMICWEEGKHKLWMRPKEPHSVKHRMWALEDQTVKNKSKGFGFYDVIENFNRSFKDTAFLVGLRAAGESPNRWRAVTKNPVTIGDTSTYWATKQDNGNASMYPIYDWNYSDVWKYIYDEQIPYSKIYDLQFMKGYPINEMRVSSLIHEKSFKSICDLPEFEPKTYEKLTKRIKGIAYAQETGRNAKMFRARKLPKNFKSWRTYRDFLIETHQDRERIDIFKRRFAIHLDNEYVARQQCRQLILNDYENNLPVDSDEDPKEKTIRYYMEVL